MKTPREIAQEKIQQLFPNDFICCGGNDDTPKEHCMDCEYVEIAAEAIEAAQAEIKADLLKMAEMYLDSSNRDSGKLAREMLKKWGNG